MQNGATIDLANYLKNFDWKINETKNHAHLTSEFQKLQRDGTHTVECYWRSLSDAEIEANWHQQNISDSETIRRAKSMHLMLENLVQHGYPKVSTWLKVEDTCAKLNVPVENNVNVKPSGPSGGATHLNSFGSKILLVLIIVATFVYY